MIPVHLRTIRDPRPVRRQHTQLGRGRTEPDTGGSDAAVPQPRPRIRELAGRSGGT